MDRNEAIMRKLAKENKKWFIQDDFDRMKITYEEKEDLLRKGFLKQGLFQPSGLNSVIYYLSDSAYMFIVAEDTRQLTKRIEGLTGIMIAFIVIQIGIYLIQLLIMLNVIAPIHPSTVKLAP